MNAINYALPILRNLLLFKVVVFNTHVKLKT